MRIEDEIQVRRFPSLEQKLSINLVYTHSWANDQLQLFFQEYKLTSQQYNVLRILRGAYPKGYSTSEILERMMEKNAGVSRLVDRLAKKGLVEKTSDKKDKRLINVLISKKAISLLKEMDEEKHRIDQVYSNLNETEMELLNRLLDKLRG